MRKYLRYEIPLGLSLIGIGVGVGLADSGIKFAALVLLGFSLAMAGVSVGARLQQRDEEDE